MANLWRQFAGLLPDAPLLLATLVTDHGEGVFTAQLIDGGFLRVTTLNVEGMNEGTRVFVRENRIEGLAPTLPSVRIEI